MVTDVRAVKSVPVITTEVLANADPDAGDTDTMVGTLATDARWPLAAPGGAMAGQPAGTTGDGCPLGQAATSAEAEWAGVTTIAAATKIDAPALAKCRDISAPSA